MVVFSLATFRHDQKQGSSPKVGKLTSSRARTPTQICVVPGHAASFAAPLKNIVLPMPGKEKWGGENSETGNL